GGSPTTENGLTATSPPSQTLGRSACRPRGDPASNGLLADRAQTDGQVLWQTLPFAMQVLPQSTPFTQCGAAGFAEVAAAGVGHLMNLPVAGSLQDFASAPPATARARAKAAK